MAQRRAVLKEYVTQIREDTTGFCIHKRAEDIVRCKDCYCFVIPKFESNPFFCYKLKIETVPEGFCCWGEKKENY